jgi:hypothetical protein
VDADLSNVTFNQNQRTDSAAIGVISATRILLVALVLNIGAVVLGVLAGAAATPILAYVAFGIAVVAFVTGAYGVFCLAESMGWKGYISAAIIFGFMIPYLKVFLVLALLIKGLLIVSASQYRFSLVGLVKKVPDLPPVPKSVYGNQSAAE